MGYFPKDGIYPLGGRWTQPWVIAGSTGFGVTLEFRLVQFIRLTCKWSFKLHCRTVYVP